MPGNRILLLFNSIHDVLRVEKILKQDAIPHELIPVPRELSSDCGMAVLVFRRTSELKGLFGRIKPSGIYSFDGREYTQEHTDEAI